MKIINISYLLRFTSEQNKQYSCRDSGYGSVTLSLWLLEWDEDIGDYVRKRDTQPLIDRAQSTQGTVEVSYDLPNQYMCNCGL